MNSIFNPKSNILIHMTLLNFRARLKNVDRSSATYHSVTVDDFTVVITEFKPKVKKEKKEKSETNNGNKNNDDSNDHNGKNGDSGDPSKGGGGNSGPSKNNHESPSKDSKPKLEPGEPGNNGSASNSGGSVDGALTNSNGLASSVTNRVEVNSRSS